MITQQDINQFKDIVETIEKDTSESMRFKKAFELCNLIFQTAKFDLVKLSENEDFALDSSIELDGLSESLNGLLFPLLNQIDKSLEEFKLSAKSNLNNLEKLNKEYAEKQKEFKNLKETQKNYEFIQNEISQVQAEIDKYEIIDIELIKKELIEKEEKLSILKSEKESDLRIWQKHLEENGKIDLNINEIDILSKEIEEKLKLLDNRIKEEYKGNI